MSGGRPSRAQRPYGLLALHYDRLNPGVAAMSRRARRKILGARLERAASVCDLGCGTGITALDLARPGRTVHAVDLAPRMCRIARARARAAGAAVRVLRADMRTFRLPAPVDLVLCEFASLNHVPARRDLARVARAVMRALRPGGLFLFDVNTPLSLKEQYAGTYWFEDPGFVMVLRAGHDARALRATLLFDWFLPRGGLWLRRRERLVNVAWTDAEIRSALTGAGFAGVRSWDGVDVRPPMPGARRGYDTYYLARRPAAR